MNRYLQDLERAFRLVGINYYSWNALNGSGSSYEQEAENNFTSEIIRQFRNIMAIESSRYSGLQNHFDVRKSRVGMQPDIVLHESPDNQNRQIFYCEVKTGTNANLTSDLHKLVRAISSELNYERAVFIVVNKELDLVKSDIVSFIRGFDFIDLTKIFLFHGIRISSDTIHFTIVNFSDIMEENRLN